MALQLAVNVPQAFEVKFLDLVKGQYGAQVRFKGRANGEEAILYVDHDPTLADLGAIGAVGALPEYDVDSLPPKGMDLSKTILKRQLTFTKVQPAGEKKARLTVVLTTNGAAAPAAKPQPEDDRRTDGGIGKPASSALAPGKVVDALTPNAPAPEKKSSLGKVWLECLDFVLANVPDRLLKADIPLDGSAISAMTAQLFIARTGGK